MGLALLGLKGLLCSRDYDLGFRSKATSSSILCVLKANMLLELCTKLAAVFESRDKLSSVANTHS